MPACLLSPLFARLLTEGLLRDESSWQQRLAAFQSCPERLDLHLELLSQVRQLGPAAAPWIAELLAARGVAVEELDPRCQGEQLQIDVASDFHQAPWNEQDVADHVRRIREDPPDLLVVAGDLASHPGHFAALLEQLAGPWTTLVLPGNHDLWSARDEDRPVQGGKAAGFPSWLPPPPPIPGWTGALPPCSQELWERLLPDLTRRAGAIWLEMTPIVIPKYRLALAGTVGWYDYSADRTGRTVAEIAGAKGTRNQDAHRIDWAFSDVEFAGERLLSLGLTLQLLAARDDVDEIAVFTHVPAFLEQRSPSLPVNDYFLSGDAYFYFPTLGRMLRDAPKVVSLVSGHTHFGHQLTIPRPGRPPLAVAVVDSDGRKGTVRSSWPRRSEGSIGGNPDAWT